jgi:Endoribonuclease YbeY
MLPQLTLSLQFGPLDAPNAHRKALARHAVARWIRHALERDAEITVRIVDAEEGQALNRDYRKKDYATNVLTFDYTQEPVVTADLVLCAPVVAQEAQTQGKTCRRTTPTSSCTASCTPRAGTMRPAVTTPKPWRRVRCGCWLGWVLPIPTEKLTCFPG